MNRPDMATVEAITGIAGTWLRRCEEQPRVGIVVNRHALGVVLAASENVAAEPDGTISWSVHGRKFTATPVRDGAEPT